MEEINNNKSNKKWLVWSIMAFSFLIVYFHRYSTAVVSDNLTSELNIAMVQLSNLASIYFYAYGLMQIPVGIMVDAKGPGLISALGMLLAAFGAVLFGLANTVEILYLARFMVGIGASTILVSTLKIQTMWFEEREFSFISGMTATIGNIGALLATTPLAFMVFNIGWRNSYLVIGGVTFLAAVAIWKVVIGSNSTRKLENKKTNMKEVLTGLKVVTFNLYTWPPIVCLICFYGSVLSFSSLWGIPYVSNIYQLTKMEASKLILVLSFGIIVGGPIMGFIGSKLGRIKGVIITGATVSTISWGLLIFMWDCKPSQMVLHGLFFLIGLATSATLQAFTNAKNNNEKRYSGIVFSVVNTSPILGTAILNMVVTSIVMKYWDGTAANGVPVYDLKVFSKALMFYFILNIIGFISSLVIREK